MIFRDWEDFYKAAQMCRCVCVCAVFKTRQVSLVGTVTRLLWQTDTALTIRATSRPAAAAPINIKVLIINHFGNNVAKHSWMCFG